MCKPNPCQQKAKRGTKLLIVLRVKNNGAECPLGSYSLVRYRFMHSPVDSYPAGRLAIQRAHVLNEFMVTAVKKLKSVTTGAFVSGTWNWQCHPEIETRQGSAEVPRHFTGRSLSLRHRFTTCAGEHTLLSP
jgi:hypothetical protein